jgi:hypothetical protein
MKFGLRSFIVLLALWVQSVSMVGPWSVAQRVAELDHALVHGQDVNHHHHASNVLHMDDDDVQAKHVHAESANSPAGVWGSTLPALSHVRGARPSESSLSLWLSPTLEGPLRPPMQHAY